MAVWRNDDVMYKTNNERFIAVDSLLKRYGVIHTIAVLAAYIDTNPELVAYIKANPHIDVQLHGWEHIDLTVQHDVAPEQLQKAVTKIEETFGKKPTVWYPPWNRADEYTTQCAANIGLTVSFHKVSLPQYIREPERFKDAIINFHSWADEEYVLLEPALQIFHKPI